MKTDKAEGMADPHPEGGSRRDFLKKSMKAAYTAPVIVSLAVSGDATAGSNAAPCNRDLPVPDGLPPCN